jgi:hypothetical protein
MQNVVKEDQHAQLQTADAPSPTALPTTTQQDETLEYDSMILLSELEQFGIRLSDKTMRTSKVLALEYLTDLTNLIVEFAEELPMATTGKLSLDNVLQRDSGNYTQLRPQHVHNNRLALVDFADLHQGILRHPNTFEGLSYDILRVVNIYLSVFVKAYRAPRMGEQWRTLYKGFIVNLTKAIRDIQGTQPR